MARQIISRLKRLDVLIAAKRTGTPKQLAEKLGLSERTVRNYITTLKELGAPIHYDRKRQSYYYMEDGHFRFAFETLAYQLPVMA
jgi:predicted DNA-binding transcriptional regulator YafY